MKSILVSLIVIVLISSVVIAGCNSKSLTPSRTNSPSPTNVQGPENNVATLKPSAMALKPTDILGTNGNYTVRYQSEKTISEVPPAAIQDGWKAGYEIVFGRIAVIESESTRIDQQISIYPIESIQKILPEEREGWIKQSGASIIIRELGDPHIGDQSIAFNFAYTTTYGGGYAILFIKKDVFELLMMSGPFSDYEILKDAARKAAEKIT